MLTCAQNLFNFPTFQKRWQKIRTSGAYQKYGKLVTFSVFPFLLTLPQPWQTMHQGQEWMTHGWLCTVTQWSNQGMTWRCNPPGTSYPVVNNQPIVTHPQSMPSTLPNASQGAFRNTGYPGSCVWYVLDQTHDSFSHLYPYAAQMDMAARQDGYTVSSVPRIGAIAVFQPGIQGANPVAGHVGIVRALGGNGSFLLAAMAQPDPWVVTEYWHSSGYGVDFIY